jgi:CHASE2 domain-containing sensor protein
VRIEFELRFGQSVTFKRKLRDAWTAGKWGAAFSTLAGLLVVLVPNTPLERWSYDLPQNLAPRTEITNLAVVYMDDASHAFLKQSYDGPWDRSLHAQLVNRLASLGATAIAFDVLFDSAGPNPSASTALAEAIRKYGRVALAADLGSADYYGLASDIKLILPHTNLLAGTPFWGFSQLHLDGDDAVRQHHHGWENVPSLSWELASMLGAKATQGRNAQRLRRWIRYYGERGTLPGISFFKVLDPAEPDAALRKQFQNKVVFIGSATESGPSGKRRDRFHAPYLKEPLWPGVDFHATQFLNLIRGDWLRRLPAPAEVGLVIFCGLLAGFGLGALRPQPACFAAVAAMAVVLLGGAWSEIYAHVWFGWLGIVAVQIPIALGFPVVRQAQRIATLPVADVTKEFGPSGLLQIADHDLLRRIGSGSYGEVWLARSATETFRAVKLVDRLAAGDPRFEREFAGLQKFEPISRAHEGLVDILHVGRNEAAGQLYYVMELADSCGSEPDADPDGYIPATLKTRLQSPGTLTIEEVGRLSLALTSALAFLHEQGLIHRDIKPSNIIFVGGLAKLADIGLVAGADETRSFVGTEGFIPPEGPGTPGADVFSLGKVLGEVLARAAATDAASEKLSALRYIIDRASARSPAMRYHNAQEMLEDLRKACGMLGFDLKPTT